ncbi:unnamed protein product, partial [marine sediment metagenome]
PIGPRNSNHLDFPGRKPIPGRLEPIDNKNGFNIFVDYAHTEDGLKKVLQALQGIVKGNGG